MTVIALLGACSIDAPTLKHVGPADAPVRDAGFDDRDAEPDFGNVDFSDPQNRPASQGGEVNDPCALGSTIGAGVMRGPLVGAEPFLQPHATLDRFPLGVPDIFKDERLPGPTRLQARREGLIASSEHGFFDVDREGSARFHRVESRTMANLLSSDLDGDGDEDVLAVGLTTDGGFALPWERGADGLLEQRTRVTSDPDASTTAAALADYDRDGDPDVITSDGDGALRALRNDGGFSFEPVALASGAVAALPVMALFAEDRNADGAVDVIALVGDGTDLALRVYANEGAGVFAAAVVTELTRSNVEQIGFEDVTGDGLSDLVLHTPVIRVARSLDATRFADAIDVGEAASGFALGDVDADGVLDIAAFGQDGVHVFFARDALIGEPLYFDVASGVLAMTIEPPGAFGFARMNALYHPFCQRPCDEDCDRKCIFGACVECIAHSDCSTDYACRDSLCAAR